MPEPRMIMTRAPARRQPSIDDVVHLLERYAAADHDLAHELDRIGAETSSSRRVSQATVSRLSRLIEDSLVPGVQAKTNLDALPDRVRRQGIARWAQLVVERSQSQPMRDTA